MTTRPAEPVRPAASRRDGQSAGSPHRARWYRTGAWIAAAAVAVSTVTVLALQAQGYQSAEVNLAESAVWVTNGEKSLVGRVNGQINELNSAVTVSPDFDVLQGGDSILVLDSTQNVVRPLDVGAVSLQPQTALPERNQVAVGGSVVAIADLDNGRIWAGELSALAGVDPTVADAQLTTGATPLMTVSDAGTVFVVVPGTDSLWTFDPTQPGPLSSRASTEPSELTSAQESAEATAAPDLPSSAGEASSVLTSSLPGGALSAAEPGSPDLSITAIGQVPVILDRAAGQLITPSTRIGIPDAATAVLQASGPGADEVFVATAGNLLAISLSTGGSRVVASGLVGGPIAPARVGDCILGAWSDTASTFLRACGTSSTAQMSSLQISNVQTYPVPDTNSGTRLQLRVQGGLAVLNDHQTGKVWSLGDGPVRIDNWADVLPLTVTDEENESADGDQASDQLTSVRADCVNDAVEPPQPADKTYGVRAGRTTVLPVLDDAASSDCSMLALVDVSGSESTQADGGGSPAPRIDIVNNGQALQVSVPKDYSGEIAPLTYSVSDGINPPVTANLELDIVAPQVSTPPRKVRDSVVEVELGGTVTYNVLQDYVSPSGDDMFVTAATISTEDEVTFKPDGTVTFADKGTGGAIAKEVEIVVSDGVNTVAARLIVDVRSVGGAEPLASPVYARTVVGEPLTVWPLRSVISPSAEPLKLSRVWAKSADPAAGAVGSQANGSVVVSSKKAGINYFLYEVSVGGKTTTGVLRVDVLERPAAGTAPVPMTDIVYLPSGGTVTLDPTINDTDPMAGGLAIAQTEVPDLGSLNLTVTEMHLIRVSAPRPVPESGGAFNYTVSNGYATAVGQVRVVQVPAPTDPLPPVAADTNITVRAGDAATLSISSLAQDPNGDLLTFAGVTEQSLAPEQGVLFSTGSALRYLAPETVPTGNVQFAYSVINTGGRKASALVNITVTPADPQVNSAPRVPAVTIARVFAGSTVSVQVPLDGIDPDGDWTTVSGISQPSTSPLGDVKVDGPQAVSYRAFSVPGIDTFGYSAVDPLGQAVIGVVKVVVVARPTTINPPLAPDLVLDIRPGRTVGVDVLSDLQDGSGARVVLADPAFAASGALSVTVEDSLLVVTAPAAEGVETIKYNVQRSGLSASGVITVRVSPTAVVKPPTAEDVFVTDEMLSADGATATVDVSELISNPGGRVRDLVLDMDPAAAGQAEVVGARELSIPLTDRRQVLSYRVTNQTDQLTAQAFIVVPSRAAAEAVAQQAATLPPQLKAGIQPLRINAGETKTVLLADYVTVATGLTAQLPAGSVLAASQGQVTRVDNATFRYAAGIDDGGDAVITLAVTDGVNASASIGIPVVIVPKVPPLPLLSSTTLEVEVGTSATVDLLPLTVPGDEKQAKILVYSGKSNTPGFNASVSGSTLTVAVNNNVPRGTIGTIAISVADDLGRVVLASVTVAATGSTEPLATLNPQTVNGRPGVEVAADVLAGSFNPFPEPLTLKSNAVVESGTAAIRVAGSQVIVTPAADQTGSVVVRFTVGDSTNDPARDVTGRLTVVVADRPEKPGTPTVLSVAGSQVQLTWTENSDRGSPILKYRVNWSGGTRECTQNPCLIDGLTNNVNYSFTVTAINAIGESDPSAASAPARPDTSPNKPGAPAATYTGSGALGVSWSDPGSSGSTVTGYNLEITPADSQGRASMSVTGTSLTWDGLSDGQGYQFRVQALNGSGQPGAWSEWGNSETPSAPPAAPAPPTVSVAGNAASIDVSWSAPQNNGAAITKYLVSVNGGAAIDVGTATSYGLANPTLGQSYSFTVIAVNRAGTGPASAASSVTAYLTPGAVELTAVATGADGKVDLSWTVPGDIGAALSPYQLTINGAPQSVPGNSFSYTGSNAVPATFSVQACYAILGTCGPSSNEVTVTPYGPPTAPTDISVSAVSTTSITFSWSTPPDNGRGPMTTEYKVGGGPWTAGTSYTVNDVCGSGPYSVVVRGLDSTGAASDPSPAVNGSIEDCDPAVTVAKTGDANGQPGCAVPECQYVRVSVTGFLPGSTVTCAAAATAPPAPFIDQTITVNGDGDGSLNTPWYYGTPGQPVTVTCTDGTYSNDGSLTW